MTVGEAAYLPVDDARRMLGPWPQRMGNPVRQYDWGSRTALARLQGRAPSGRPEAELWMGAHPSAPSALLAPDGSEPALDALIAGNPDGVLGGSLHRRFGPRLPFLLKVLAIARPLSLQVHPGADRARAAFDGEVEIDGGSPYVDPHAKPELLYALEPVDALCGFRSADSAARLLRLADGERTDRIAEPLEGPGAQTDCVEQALRVLLTWPQEDRADLAADVGRSARALLARAGSHRSPGALSPSDRLALMWTARLARHFPTDPLVAAPLLLDLVRLEPGETLFVPAGAPHAYLYGMGVEIMGNSDNVLRAGLTHKRVAIEELLHVVDGDSRPVRDVPEVRVSPHEVIWRPGVAEFQLSRIRVHDATPVHAYPYLPGPQVLLCTAGAVGIACGAEAVALTPGESAFVGAGGGPVIVAGPGEVFRAAAGVQG
jgi:mannose-6-phosphate isomerase